MYPNYNKPFMSNPTNPAFGATPSTFGNFQAGTSTQAAFGTNLFAQQQPSTSGNLFNNSNAFGQNKPATNFGFGSVPNQTGLFGQQAQQQQQQQQPAQLFQGNSTNLFGANTSFGNTNQIQQQGTVIKFAPITGTDTMQKNGVAQSISTKHHCITCMKEYEHKSLEELRSEDYQCNRKGPQEQSAFSAAPFGANTTAQSTSLFGQTPQKQGFGQPTAFGQTAPFGQNTSGFGTTTQTTTATPLFGNKTSTFGVATTNTNNFGFNATSTNLFNTTQTKPFTQPSLFSTNTTPSTQSAFGTGLFGQTSTQSTTAPTNLFQKPPQPTTGFPFNQPTSQPSANLFQMQKPATNFGMFGQTNPATTPFGQAAPSAFGNSFGKTTAFTQPTQSGFATAGAAPLQQQPSIFGNNANKSTNLFGNLGGNTLMQNTGFQQAPTAFNMNPAQPQSQFPQESFDEYRGIPMLASDTFPEGPQIQGLEPLFNGVNTTRTSRELNAILDSSKKSEDLLGDSAKIKVHSPKIIKRVGTHYSRDFFEPNQSMKNSHKCLVIRKFNSNTNLVLDSFENPSLEDNINLVPVQRLNNEHSPSKKHGPTSIFYESISNESLHREKSDSATSFTSTTDTDSNRDPDLDPLPNLDGIDNEEEEDEDDDSDQNNGDNNNTENPAGVVLAREEYYMFPPLNELHDHIDENGRCIVQGLTIGRRGYGNVYFPDPIDITDMNLDDIIHFRHREVIVYADENKKPPIGEGLNRKAQVTLDKIYPREKGTDTYITEVDKIIESNFVDKLMHVTQKHKCKFIDYRPKTGSWVFKVKHFSKYAFTESDEDECELTLEKLASKKPLLLLKDLEVDDSLTDISLVGGGDALISDRYKYKYLVLDPKNVVDESFMIDYAEDRNGYLKSDFGVNSATNLIKLSIFNGTKLVVPQKVVEVEKPPVVPEMPSKPCEVICLPDVDQIPDVTVSVLPDMVKKLCRTEYSLSKQDHYIVGWKQGLVFFSTEVISSEAEIVYASNSYSIKVKPDKHGVNAMPHIDDILQVAFNESVFNFDDDEIPTLEMKSSLAYLNKQTELFNKFAVNNDLMGDKKYLAHMWNLCKSLWGAISDPGCTRRQSLSNWLSRASNDLWEDIRKIRPGAQEKNNFSYIFQLLSRYRIKEAAEFARECSMSHASLLISEAGGSPRFKQWMEKHLSTFHSEKGKIVPDELKVINMLLAAVYSYEGSDLCKDIKWLRCFGLYLWYLAPGAAPIDVVFNMFKEAASSLALSDVKEDDILYQLIGLHANRNYELNKVLHPTIRGTDMTDYRISWLLLQLFTSLGIGLIKPLERDYLHSSFASQLESIGEWKWAVFVLLFLKNNHMKKQLIMDILDRHLLISQGRSENVKDIVEMFKLPLPWIHELMAVGKGKLKE